MQLNQLNLLRCPNCKSEFEMQKNHGVNRIEFILRCESCSKDFVGNENFVDFMGTTMPFSGKWENLIRSLYAKIYTPVTNLMFLLCGGVKNAKNEVLDNLEIKNNYKVLETGIGAAENFYLLNRKANNLDFYGIDIQNQMLIHSIKNLKKWKIKASLYRSDAHFLPFKDESFDVVFHLGSINLFPDKKKAIDEMIRVAKPGTKIVIADESQKAGKLLNILSGINEDVIPPIDLIPKEMLQPTIQTIWQGYGYLIQFRKPLKPIKKEKKAKNKLQKSYDNSLQLI